jgi:putative drug exporter of the RND superfamily
MGGFLEVVGRASVRLRWFVVVAWILAAVACAHFLPSLSSVVDTQNSAFLPADQPSVQAAALEAPFQSSGTSQALLVASRGGAPLTAADQQAIAAASRAIEKVPNVSIVKNVATSATGAATLVSIAATVPPAGGTTDALVADIRQVLAKPTIEGVRVPSGLSMALTGSIAVSADNARANQAAQARTELLSYLIIIVILAAVYRSVLGPIVNLVPAGVVLVLSGPLVASLARHGLPVSAVAPVMMTVLVLGAGTDYGLFLIMRFREELEAGLEPHDAIVAAMRQVGESVVFAALTVSAALFCLLISSFGVYRGIGPALAISILLMLAASITLTPALVAIGGRAMFWPTRVRPGSHHEGLWGRVAERCARRPVLTCTAGVAVLGILALGFLGFATTGFSGGNASPAGSQSAEGSAVLAEYFPASVTNPTDLLLVFPEPVWSSPAELDALAQAQASFSASPLLHSVNGPTNPLGITLTPAQLGQLHAALGPPSALPVMTPATLPPGITAQTYQLYRSVGQYVSPDARTVRYASTLATGNPTDAASVAAVPGLRSLAASVAQDVGATRNGVYGFAAYSYDVERVANRDLLQIFPVVGIVIGVLLGVLLRSVVAPLFLLATVALSYAATLGLTNLIFVHLGSQPGINFVLPFLLFVFLVALGEDYNILVMSRIREESLLHGTERHGVQRSVVAAVGATGTTITSAGIILAGTFGVVGLAGGSSQLQEIGTALALGILLDTFIVRTLLVPSIAQLLGHWTWWPSRLGRMEAAAGLAQAPAPTP